MSRFSGGIHLMRGGYEKYLPETDSPSEHMRGWRDNDQLSAAPFVTHKSTGLWLIDEVSC
ncbi:MAG: hypothetical protein R3C20_21105 [Planctomycetaceae bacterium]